MGDFGGILLVYPCISIFYNILMSTRIIYLKEVIVKIIKHRSSYD